MTTAELLDRLRARGETLSTAESVTAGLIVSMLADVAGASDVLRGGVAAYATGVKTSVLGVDRDLIDREGVVSAACAEAMAVRATLLFETTWAVSATGVAGPTEQDGVPVGTVYVAAAGPGRLASRLLELGGGRATVRAVAATAALALLGELIPSAAET
jgi:nicotinamide-nucleotide amidase